MPPSWTPPDINIMAGESCEKKNKSQLYKVLHFGNITLIDAWDNLKHIPKINNCERLQS